ncbi:MAG: apolipoprotein N-acyltransferase [Thermonema sp.]|uniref:apolipoprotein N-acyltransferase n=1 Tax=Thermonema sp. TaxID=2231181 RepID=UPI0021DD63BD|nr:apolipoprotein N-acyltransferase [Thermonema sp.]GIV40161.1 MAG: apolipoprotein N-acyltransferase [Thermonema sp.]
MDSTVTSRSSMKQHEATVLPALYVYGYAALAALLFSVAWYVPYLHISIFFAFVPLLRLLHAYRMKLLGGKRLLAATYLAFALWNIATTWWIWNASAGGAVGAWLANALLMCLPVVVAMSIARKADPARMQLTFVLAWLTFEYLHLNWELSWSWLQLGNAFALVPAWVQWYEFTGVLGGTLWVLLTNLVAMRIFTSRLAHNRRVYAFYTALLILLPIGVSYWLAARHETKGETVEVVVMQPNIDPYQEKFPDSPNFIPFAEQIRRFMELSKQQITPNTRLILWPETAIDDALWEENIHNYAVIRQIKNFMSAYPQAALITGLTTARFYKNELPPASARYQEGLGYYDVFNTAMFLKQDTLAFYHKSKLVPMVEAMPYPAAFQWLSNLVIDLGGTSGGYGKQAERTVFTDGNARYAPIICFESVFGEYVGEYVQKGGNLLCIITNDGWWGDTPGYKQHMRYACLRAIEHRRAVARCANTGISAFINTKGEVLQSTPYWVPVSIRDTLILNNELTFYSRYGDYLGRLALFVLAALWLSLWVRHWRLSGLIKK